MSRGVFLRIFGGARHVAGKSMARFFPFFPALLVGALLLVSFLVVFKSPDWSYWTMALLAGEFGHWLSLLAFLLAGIAWGVRGTGPVAFSLMAIAAAIAGVLFLRPVVLATRISRELPRRLERSFGETNLERPAFSLVALGRRDPPPILSQSFKYAGDLALDFFPAVGRRNAPCVIVVHGGGWNGGERGEFPRFNHWLAGKGYAVAAISYRLAPENPWPAQREDIAAAIAFLKARAASLDIDPTRLVLFGRSAGGHLAEATAYSRDDQAIRGVIALYSPADVYFAWEFARDDDVLKSPQLLKDFLGGAPDTARAAYDSASPIRFVGANTPPTLLIHGALDTLVWHRQSERLAQKLSEVKVPHAFVSLPWATHAFEYNLNGPGGQIATYSIEWFLAAVTK
jgi:acetyl esterase/lipase